MIHSLFKSIQMEVLKKNTKKVFLMGWLPLFFTPLYATNARLDDKPFQSASQPMFTNIETSMPSQNQRVDEKKDEEKKTNSQTRI